MMKFIRSSILPSILASFLTIATPCDGFDGSHLVEVGYGTYGDKTVLAWDNHSRAKIGKFCSLSDIILVLGGEPRDEWVTTYPFNVLWPEGAAYSGHPKSRGDINIGHDVWIGMKSMILSGVTIGDGAVVGANSLVDKDVPPYAIVAGNPAKFIKYRFNESIIQKLQQIAWWNWPNSDIISALPYLLSGNIDYFIKYCELTGKL